MALKTRFQLRRSTTGGVVPTTSDLGEGELGINLVDRKLYVANSTAVYQIAGNGFPAVEVANNNTLVGKQPRINFIAGTNVTLAISDHTAGSQINVQISATGGSGSPGGANTEIQFNDSTAFGANALLRFEKDISRLTLGNTTMTYGENPEQQVILVQSSALVSGISPGYMWTSNGNIISGTDSYATIGIEGSPSFKPYMALLESDGANTVLADFNADGGKLTISSGTGARVAVINSTAVFLANTTSNTKLTIPTTVERSATNYFLHANGSWVQITGGGGGTPGGANTQIQFNDSGAFGGIANLTFDKTASRLTVGNSTVNTQIAGALSTFTSNVVMSNATIDYARIKSYAEESSAPTISGGTLTLDLNVSNIFNVNLNSNITTLNINNPQASGNGVSFTLILTADGTPRTVAWTGSIRWANGVAPAITSTNNKRDLFVFLTLDGGTSYNGIIAGQNF